MKTLVVVVAVRVKVER